MIRHSSSFILSLILHIVILLAVFFIYKSIPKKESVKIEKKVRIDLSNVTIKQTPKIIPVVQTRKIIPQETLLKSKIKQVVKKKTPKLKPIPIKNAPKIQEMIEPKKVLQEIKPIQEIKEEPKKIIDNKVEHFKEVTVENLLQKQKRLEQEYISQHIREISQLLSENLYYPRSARKRNIQGSIIVRFTLSTSAKVHNITIVSSKSEILSRAAIKTIEDLSGSFPHPAEELVLHVPITYKLSQ